MDRLARVFAVFAAITLFVPLIMLYSQGPADKVAVLAHFVRITGELFLLFSLTQMGTADTARRMLVERELKASNEALEARVAERTAEAFSSGECEFLRQSNEAHRARRAPGAALRRAAAGLRRPAPDAAAGHAAGTTARARPDGERHRARHQQRHLAGGAVHRGAARARTGPEPSARAEQLEIIQRAVDDVAQTVARMGEFYRLREPQVALAPVDLNLLVGQVIDLTRARWSDMAQQRGVAIEAADSSSRPTCRRSPRWRARFATR